MTATPSSGQSTGPSVDRVGAPVIDPTENVKALSEAAAKRQDDLRAKDKEISDIKHQYQAEMGALRAHHEAIVGKIREEHQTAIQKSEADRLNSIRQVDREEVAKTAVALNTAITTLAKQTTDLSTTLAKQVTDTAAALESRNSAQYSDTNKRLSALELSSSEGKGKQAVVDPQMDRLTALVERMASNQAMGSGAQQATKDYTAWILGGVGILLGLSAFVFNLLRATQ